MTRLRRDVADRAVRAHRRHPDRGARRRRRLASTGCACPASTPARASPRCSATPDTGAGCIAPGRRRGPPGAATATTRSCSRPSATRPRAPCASSTACRPRPARRRRARRRGRQRARADAHGALVRFDYGCIVPWVRTIDGSVTLVAGPDALCLDHAGADSQGHDYRHTRRLRRRAGDRVPFVLAWYPSHDSRRPTCSTRPTRARPHDRVRGSEWVGRSHLRRRRGATRCMRSLITLKALTYAPTGGIVAAPTTSLPEWIGGVRNWDYRYCWLRDATFTLYALIDRRLHRRGAARGATGCCARWPATRPTCRSCTGRPASAGSTEYELDWLPGYEGSTPVRVGNAAHRAVPARRVRRGARRAAPEPPPGHRGGPRRVGARARDPRVPRVRLARARRGHLGGARRPRSDFTHSKVMAWVAFDRAVQGGRGVRARRARSTAGGTCRDEIHAEVCERGLRRRAQRLHPVLRLEGARRQRC